MRDLHLPGRSVVMGRHGAAATSHFLSTLTAIEILRRGGNAADAAIAACAVQCVVEPGSTGIGGDNFVLFAPARSDPAGKVYGLNGSGRAPRGLTTEHLLKQGLKEIGLTSVHAVTIPGAVDAWSKLNRRFGSMPLAELLQPAIRYAEEGFIVTERVATDWHRNEDKLKADANSARMWLKEGSRSLRDGEIFRQPEHAKVFREIAAKGRDGFYTGWVAEDIVAYLRSLGGLHALEDFATQEAFWVEPISTTYRGIELFEIPPSGVGITTLLMLNILSGFDLSKYDPVGVERFHIEAEATRLAFEAREKYVADPVFADVPVQKLLSAGFADELRGRIDVKKAMPALCAAAGTTTHRDTVYISVVDEEGNACSFINSLFWSYGTGLSSPKTGVLLQNRGTGFSLDAEHPNCVAPQKRPLHTIIPAMAMKDSKPWLCFGVMGGGFQPVGQSHVLTNILDFGMNVQEAIDCARGFHQMGRFEAERGIREDVLRGLAALGHEIKMAEMPHGGGQAIMIDAANGVLRAGSDARKDGCALAY
ncbi:gamma-glutamyltransferase [Ensifer sp. IC4062]|nr:gamma-glutamyltransferase [Ensifer sp. IC4062]MCA1441614.1 gamma-glutamyltransferase [Ensifer sp. IC4062]